MWRSGKGLVPLHLAGLINHNYVGECAAYIRANSQSHLC
jgi:hypothetical protein